MHKVLFVLGVLAPLLVTAPSRALECDDDDRTAAQRLPKQGFVQVHVLDAGVHYQPSAIDEDGRVHTVDLLGHDGGPALVSVWEGPLACDGSERDGAWAVTPEGHVFIGGGAAHHGHALGESLNQPIVGMAVTATGGGYWLVGSDGGIFTYGDAGYFGSTGALALNQPIVAMAATPTGRGYWLAAADGGLFTFGDARFLGSMGATPLNQPIVGMVPTSTGNGYWMVARDGGIFTFGDAEFLGSTAATATDAPIVGMIPSGEGYAIVDQVGTVSTFRESGETSTDGHEHGDEDDTVSAGSIISLDDPRVTDEQRAAAQSLIDRTTSGMARFPNEAAVLAAGYTSLGDAATGFEHLLNLGYLLDDAVLDEDRIESVVLRVADDGTKTVESAMYILPIGTTMSDVPDIAGALTTWHDHDDLCFDFVGGTLEVIGLAVSGRCAHGTLLVTPPMLHVWITPQPCGPFAGIETGNHGTDCHTH